MLRAALLAILILALAPSTPAQDWTAYLNGTFHRPTITVDEFGSSLPPLLLYKDSDVEVYVPDFTSTAESKSRPQAFKHNGGYQFIIYTYDVGSHKTNRSFIVGNAQSGEIHLHKMDTNGGLYGPVVDYRNNKGLPDYLDHSILAYMKLMVYLHDVEGQ